MKHKKLNKIPHYYIDTLNFPTTTDQFEGDMAWAIVVVKSLVSKLSKGFLK
jgi:hypothetical protein